MELCLRLPDEVNFSLYKSVFVHQKPKFCHFEKVHALVIPCENVVIRSLLSVY